MDRAGKKERKRNHMPRAPLRRFDGKMNGLRDKIITKKHCSTTTYPVVWNKAIGVYKKKKCRSSSLWVQTCERVGKMKKKCVCMCESKCLYTRIGV